MSTTSLRRRGFGNNPDSEVTILHPDYFHVQNWVTTEENQKVNTVYGEYTGQVILDGEPLANNLYYYQNSWGGFIIPEPGVHEFYVKNTTNSFKNVRIFIGITRPHRSANYLRDVDTVYRSITKLILIQSEIPSTYHPLTKTKFPNLEEIIVPLSMEEAYKNAWPDVADLIKGVEFNIIEDE